MSDTSDETFIIKPWRRYGMRRLYIESDDGIKLGWWDELTETGHPEDGVPDDLLRRAVAWHTAAAEPATRPRRAIPFDGEAVSSPDPESADPATAPQPPAEQPPPVLSAPAGPTGPPSALSSPSPAGEDPVPPAAVEQEGAVAWDLAQSARADVEFRQAPPALQFPPPVPYEDLASHAAGALVAAKRREVNQRHPRAYFAARVFGIHTEERAWRVGARGEELVGDQLRKLQQRDPRWFVIHSVPIGQGDTDVDHLVIGPGGVFTLNTKHHPSAKVWVGGGTVMVNGRRQPYVPKARGEASRVQRLLAPVCGYLPPTRAALVLVGVDRLTIKEAPSDVHITTRRELPGWLRHQPEVLSDEQVALLFEMARRSSTWR